MVIEEEEEEEISDNEASQKKFLKLIGKKKTTGKKVVSKKRPFKTITKNYCPDDAPDSQHKLKNNQKYIQIRKGGTGANIPVTQFKWLKQAILDLEQTCNFELAKEELTDESADDIRRG